MTHPHLIATAADAQQFVLGGRARFTLVSKQTGKRYTYRVSKAKDTDDVFFASLLVGQNNEQDYEYIGFTKNGNALIPGKKGNPSHPAFLGRPARCRSSSSSGTRVAVLAAVAP